jgi:hypothetical protein
MTGQPANPRAADVHAPPTLLTASRLPSSHRHWPVLAERADKEGWPAARLLAALTELELAETRRVRRPLIESPLPSGRPWPPSTSRRSPASRAPASRPSPPATGSRPAPPSSPSATAAPARRTCSALSATPASRPADASATPAPPISCPTLQAARRDPALEAALAKPDRFDLTSSGDPSPGRLAVPPPPRRHPLRPEGSGRNLRPLRTHRPALRNP